ncbi:MAG TPA: RNA polymerase sigma-70 factor [Chitinophaga sp.]|uniref:RNA polymerase sigma-70 factor n=1 Tax=Chitinophaga sp. TaxID=1869181 RepID=UPI002CCCC021|nr:RNA polymerase sigma-70 factor [Chitinophaga sp.]HVI43423.1 RNA polymerase sigma-70 factor [Chitinophaga sp.]
MIKTAAEPALNPDCFDLQAFRIGDNEAFKTLFRTYYGPLCYFSQKMNVDRSSAEEIAEDALVKIWTKRNAFSHVQAIKAFLYVTVKNASLNVLRSQQREARRRNRYTDMLIGHDEPCIEEAIIELETVLELDRAIASLPPGCRQVITMSLYQGMKVKEIACQLGISQSTVLTQRQKGVDKLRKLLSTRTFLVLQALLLH